MVKTTHIVTRVFFTRENFLAVERIAGKVRVWWALRESLDGDEGLSSRILDRTLIVLSSLLQVFPGLRRQNALGGVKPK